MDELTEQQLETRAVWKSIEGSNALLEIYGYYPTLHDACIVGIDVYFEGRQLTAAIEYSDLVETEGRDKDNRVTKATKIIMRWNGVAEANVRIHGNDVYHLSFSKKGGKIATDLISGWGVSGTIVADFIEVVSIQDSDRDSYPEELLPAYH